MSQIVNILPPCTKSFINLIKIYIFDFVILICCNYAYGKNVQIIQLLINFITQVALWVRNFMTTAKQHATNLCWKKKNFTVMENTGAGECILVDQLLLILTFWQRSKVLNWSTYDSIKSLFMKLGQHSMKLNDTLFQ